MVASLCAEMDVPHQILNVEIASGNMQAQARVARYRALAGWMETEGLHLLATAHQADDQAETLIMRLNRGSGVSGLAGVRAQSNVPGSSLHLVRPLLGWRKQELEEIVSAMKLDAIEDPSNRDEKFDRVRIRNALADADWIDVPALAQSAAHLADAADALDWAVDHEWANCVKRIGDGLQYRPQAPRAVRLEVLVRAIAALGSEPRGSAAARLLEALENGERGNVGGVLAVPEKGVWMLRCEPPRR
jgi:tRNA(Ile)-lysidine synthase